MQRFFSVNQQQLTGFSTSLHGYKDHMPTANWVIVLHFVALWGSVITGLMADWRLPISILVAIPLGLLLWAAGFLFNMYVIQRARQEPALHRAEMNRRRYQRIAARTLMNVGVGLAFRSWLTLIVAAILIPFYAAASRSRQRYLEYMRTGMQDDAFPDRTRKG